MSRIAKKPIEIPAGTDITISGQTVSVKSKNGTASMELHDTVAIAQNGSELKQSPKNDSSMAMAGTMRSLVHNMIIGTSQGFEKKLQLIGVGYRAQAQGNVLNLTLGFSHPVNYAVPEGITIETPSQTEILVKGIDKQKVGQVSADRKSTRLNSSHRCISYAVFCLKKKKQI